jgi:hypothetical protein
MGFDYEPDLSSYDAMERELLRAELARLKEFS